MTATMACAPAGKLRPHHETCPGWVYPGNRRWENPVLCDCPEDCGHPGAKDVPPRASWERR